MSDWSLKKILSGLHDDIQRRLETVRETMAHPGTKGDASEGVWNELFNKYLPARYKADKAHVVDSKGTFSQQIDTVIYDRQYSPFIFHFEGQIIIPAESVYAVFEAKQSANLDHVKYAQEKVQSVRRLHRTSLSIPYAGGTYPAKPLIPIYGGFLTFESDWSPAIGDSFLDAVRKEQGDGKLDCGCVGTWIFSLNRYSGGVCRAHWWQACHRVFVQADFTTSVQRHRPNDRRSGLQRMASGIVLLFA